MIVIVIAHPDCRADRGVNNPFCINNNNPRVCMVKDGNCSKQKGCAPGFICIGFRPNKNKGRIRGKCVTYQP